MAKPRGFQFKQFFIAHDQCAMKVGTDSIMLGSWVNPNQAKNILDIGTGSGLLAIMMAQKSLPECDIIGVDINEQAIAQATTNGTNSPWPNKLKFELIDVKAMSVYNKFDLIVCNPPYYVPKTGELHPDDPQYIASSRRQARHTISLNFEALITTVIRLLTETGRFYCVLPESEAHVLKELAQQRGLFCVAQLLIRPSSEKPVSRRLLQFSLDADRSQEAEITVRTTSGEYTSDYKNLCKDFYLNF